MKKLIILSLAACLFYAIALFAQNPNLGTSGAQFLKIGVSARAVGMGSAYVGMCHDASSVFWNPAGIAGVKSNAAQLSHMRWFDSFDVNAASYIYNAGNYGAFAVSMMMLTTDKMEITTEFSPNGTGRFFDAQDIAIGFSYARNLTDRFCVGLTTKYVRQSIWNEAANGVAFDVGTQYKLPFKNLTIAMSMTNFGPDMKFDGPDLSVKYDADPNFPNRLIPTRLETEAYPLPLNFKFGISMELYRSNFIRVITAIDAVHPNDNREQVYFGSEIALYDRLYLRGGYKLYHDDEEYNLGFGITTFLSGVLLTFDYAYSTYSILPNAHLFTFGINL